MSEESSSFGVKVTNMFVKFSSEFQTLHISDQKGR
jgi:hypothetical protein